MNNFLKKIYAQKVVPHNCLKMALPGWEIVKINHLNTNLIF